MMIDPEISERHNAVNVLILGGGLAGLGAAIQLKNTVLPSGAKCSFLILEGQEQAGGRVKSQKLLKYSKIKDIVENFQRESMESSSNLVDGGAQWLHGRDNILYTIAESHKLLASNESDEGLGCFFYENCQQIDPFLVKKVDHHVGELLHECEKFATSKTTYPKSVGHFLHERFQQFIDMLENPNDIKIAMDLFDWHMRFQMIDNSCLTLDHLSAKYWGKYSLNGESQQAHYNFKNGFQSVVDCIIEELGSDSIHCNKDVFEICINNHRNIVINNRKPKNVTVKCRDGSSYHADVVMITFSLGLLKKKHEKLFQPSLPGSMQLAIESIGFQTINKIFLEFSTPWWDELDGIQFVFSHRDKKTKWTQYLTGFDVLVPHQKNILLGWVGGIGAIQMETLTDEQIIEDCICLLTKFTKINVPYPVHYYCTRWNSNPFVCGAYSYISTECDKNETISNHLLNRMITLDEFYPENETDYFNRDETNDTINRELSKHQPVVVFAGEACHEKYFSTAHGALLSGIEQAQKIINFF